MGMAAGQARLLSITARMSDNELRAQIINNDKMRLASESSQVSDTYVQALNEAELMFTNYDADNNASYKQLTYNALTAYNPYNNQYCLTNASGNILLSETDYNNYKQSDSVEEFLKCYGLEQTTTYFDNLAAYIDPATGTATDYVAFTNPDVEDDPTTDINETTNQSTGLTKKQLELAYLGVDEYKRIHEKDDDYSEDDLKIDMNGASGVEPLGYDYVLNSAKMYDYVTALEKYTQAYDKLLSYVSDAMHAQMDNICAACNGTLSDSTPLGLSKFYNDKILKLGENDLTDGIKYLNVLGDMAKTGENSGIKLAHNSDFTIKDDSGKEAQEVTDFFEIIDDLIKENNSPTISHVYNTDTTDDEGTYAILQETEGDFIVPITKDSDGNWVVGEKQYKIDGSTLYVQDDTGNWTKKATEEDGVTVVSMGTKSSESFSGSKGEKLYSISGSYTVNTPNSVDNIKNVAKVIYNMYSNPDKIWDAEDLDTWIKILIDNGNSNAIEAKEDYDNASQELADVIYGEGTYNYNDTTKPITETPKASELGKISLLYNNIGKTDYEAFIHEVTDNDFYQVYLNIVLDNVQDTYGEPHFTWIDTSSPSDSYNENGEAKAKWYENIWNMCEKNGCKALKDGLASSTEWIQYAFESGIVNMQQVDSNGDWNPLIYSNCSDITSQTSDKKIAQAEAEYNAAMNKIENKDKRYDLELKNIDTEHNSLQTEYESIKSALDKHIERVFKLYS